MPYIFMGESSSQYVTTLKSLVNIGILIVKMKNVSSKHVSYEYLLLLKNWVHWITTPLEKNVATSKMYILRRSTQKLKNLFFPLGSVHILRNQVEGREVVENAYAWL